MSLNFVTPHNAEERHRDLLARAEASRLARSVRRQRRARTWLRRGRRPVAQPGPVGQSGPVEVPPQRIPADAAVGEDREVVLTAGPAAN
jgi:hypothetical protein